MSWGAWGRTSFVSHAWQHAIWGPDSTLQASLMKRQSINSLPVLAACQSYKPPSTGCAKPKDLGAILRATPCNSGFAGAFMQLPGPGPYYYHTRTRACTHQQQVATPNAPGGSQVLLPGWPGTQCARCGSSRVGLHWLQHARFAPQSHGHRLRHSQDCHVARQQQH